MPQVDKVTFWPQVFWLATLLILFYVIFLRDFITNILNTLKVRSAFYTQNIRLQQRNQIQMLTKNIELSFLVQALLTATLLQTKQSIATDAKNWLLHSLEHQLAESELISASFEGQMTLLFEEMELNDVYTA